MSSTINYENLGTLMNLAETISKLDDYLFHIRNYLETELKSFNIDKQLNIKEQEYVVVQELNEVTIKVGFNWEYDNIYFGVRVFLPRTKGGYVLDITDKLQEYEWGYGLGHGIDEEYFVLNHERRLVDQLFTNEGSTNEWRAIMDLFRDRIDECKIIIDELKK